MQILPFSSSSAPAAAGGVQASDGDAHGFSRMFGQYLEHRPAEITPSLETSMDGEGGHAALDSNPHSAVGSGDDMFAARSPYLKTGDGNNAAGTGQEIRFTPAEAGKIAENLQASGVDPAVVQEILKLVGSPLGVTAPDMLKAMAEAVRKPAKVTDADMARIASLAQRLDREGGLSAQVLDDVRDGRTTQAWQKILGALNAQGPDSRIALDHDEIQSLGKGLGLSARTLDALHKAFGGNGRLRISPDQAEQILTSIQHELGERQAQTEKLAAAFEKALTPVAQEARMRIAAEESAAGRASRSVQHAAVLIQDTVTRNGLPRQNAAPERTDAAARTDGAAARAARTDGTTTARADGMAAARADGAVAHMEAAAARPADNAASGKETGKEGGSARGDDRRERADAGKSGWADFLDRIRYQDADADAAGAGKTSDLPQAVSMMANTTPGASQTGQEAQAASRQPVLPPYAPQVLRQVEQGLLTAMRDGSQRLELQLSPEHLGTLNVLLTVKNGEISAVLRPERTETATLLNQQTDQLRFVLEQQGIKVDKVEVQTQLQDGRNSMAWQGMEQHNASREREAREEQGRILRIGRLHRNSSDSLDRNMQVIGQGTSGPATSAGRGLHIIT